MNSNDLFEFFSQSDEFSDYEVGEDNEGQLIIYTGLYRARRTSEDDQDVWEKPNKDKNNA